MNLNEFYGPNAGYVWELLDRYRRDPNSVDAQTRAFFDQHAAELEALERETLARETTERETEAPIPAAPRIQPEPSTAGVGLDSVVKVVNLANAIREYGHLAAHLPTTQHFTWNTMA